MEDFHFPARPLNPTQSQHQLGPALPTSPQGAPQPGLASQQLLIVAKTIALLAGFACTLVWMVSLHVKPGPMALLNHLALLVAAFCWSYLACATLERLWFQNASKRSLIAAILISSVAFVWWARIDTYEETWTNKEGFRFHDTLYRSGGIKHRSFAWPDEEGIISHHEEGDMSPSGKPHGEWESFYWHKGEEPEIKRVWFWYGDEVSEGEWHLRNR